MSQNLQPHPDRMTDSEIVETTYRLLSEFGLEGWRVAINKRLTQTYGRCNYQTRTIDISAKLALINPAERTEDTIRHEIAHALTEPGVGHGPVWKAACRVTGATPRRCFSAKDTNTIATKRRKVSVQGVCEPCGGVVIAVRTKMPAADAGYRHKPSKCRVKGGAPVTWVRIGG